MKKTLILLTALALIISAIAVPVLAEDAAGTVDQTTSATTRAARGGRNNQMPGNGKNNRMPQMPGQNNQQSQAPDQNSQLPGRGGRKGGRFGDESLRTEKLENWLAQLVKDNVITQEVSDAILSYVKEQAAQAGTAAAAPADSPAAEETPAGSPEEQLLKEMLDNGVITQEQYDQYSRRISAPEPPAAEEAAGT